jgi:hypothetical protein
MAKSELSRRKFIGKTAAGLVGVAVSSSGTSMGAASYSRIIGANDRINIGFLGCGSRSSDHQRMVKTSEKDKNIGVVAVCDIWKLNKEKAAANCKKLFGTDVKQFKYSEEMLIMPELDAVMIGTGDFQHAKILAEVVIVKNQWRLMLKKLNWQEVQFLRPNRLYSADHNGLAILFRKKYGILFFPGNWVRLQK